jgi:murein L,D-transpeptidase YafK
LKKLIFITVVVILVSVVALTFVAKRMDNPVPEGVAADKILIEKSKRRLTLLNKDKAIKAYVVSLGKEPMGKKTEEGDGRTPEGIYTIDRRKLKSSYHRALHVSYPNTEDTAQAKARGVSPGGDIMIHGLPNSIGFIGKLHTKRDWTLGCIAVTNPEIEEIWRVVPDGTTVEIVH